MVKPCQHTGQVCRDIIAKLSDPHLGGLAWHEIHRRVETRLTCGRTWGITVQTEDVLRPVPPEVVATHCLVGRKVRGKPIESLLFPQGVVNVNVRNHQRGVRTRGADGHSHAGSLASRDRMTGRLVVSGLVAEEHGAIAGGLRQSPVPVHVVAVSRTVTVRAPSVVLRGTQSRNVLLVAPVQKGDALDDPVSVNHRKGRGSGDRVRTRRHWLENERSQDSQRDN